MVDEVLVEGVEVVGMLLVDKNADLMLSIGTLLVLVVVDVLADGALLWR